MDVQVLRNKPASPEATAGQAEIRQTGASCPWRDAL
jgi:hypothetical protein